MLLPLGVGAMQTLIQAMLVNIQIKYIQENKSNWLIIAVPSGGGYYIPALVQAISLQIQLNK